MGRAQTYSALPSSCWSPWTRRLPHRIHEAGHEDRPPHQRGEENTTDGACRHPRAVHKHSPSCLPLFPQVQCLTSPVAMETIRAAQEGTGAWVGRDDAATTRPVPLGRGPGQGGEDSRESPLAQRQVLRGLSSHRGCSCRARARPCGAGALPQASGVITVTATAWVPSSCAAALP